MNTTMNRRRLLSQSVTAMVAGAVPSAALASSALDATAVQIDPAFQDLCDRFQMAREALNRCYAEGNAAIKDLERQSPDLPQPLLEPLDLPHDGLRHPGEDGWSENILKTINQGRWSVFELPNDENGLIVRETRHPVTDATRQRAGELLQHRQEYERARKAWWSQVSAIEKTFQMPLDAMDDIAFEALAHPIRTMAEMVKKIEIGEEINLFDSSGPRLDEAKEHLFRDIKVLAGVIAS